MESPIKWEGNCNEPNAVYATDGYARLPVVFCDESLVTGTKFVISIKATTEEKLELAMKAALSERDKLIFKEAYIPNRTCSEGLERLGNSYKMSLQKQ